MSLLERLDNYYNNRKPSEAWLMVTLFGLLIGFLLYTLVSDFAYNYRTKEETRNLTLNSNITNAKSYLDSITVNGDRDYYLKDLDKKIIDKRLELNDYRKKLSKLDGAVEQLSSVLYNNGNWSKFLHNIATKAKENSLKVYNISNKVYDQNSSFGKVLDVNIKCEGEYSQIVSFINDLEKTKLVTNVSNLKLKSSSNYPIADINLTVWGIKP